MYQIIKEGNRNATGSLKATLAVQDCQNRSFLLPSSQDAIVALQHDPPAPLKQ
jgi:hypothetical protein